MTTTVRLLETAFFGIVGGFIFYLGNLPLPWVLGSLTFVMLWQGFTRRKACWPQSIRNGGFIVLGTYFGLYFGAETIKTIAPYFIPYLFVTCILIMISIFIGLAVTKWIPVDQITSVFGSIPGGLSEMVLASESLHANSSLVVIFQTVRLLTVLFTVPGAIIYYFSDKGHSSAMLMDTFVFDGMELFLVRSCQSFVDCLKGSGSGGFVIALSL